MNTPIGSASFQASMTLAQLVDQMRALRELGPVSTLLGMLPGEIGRMASEVRQAEFEKTFQILEAIVGAMSPEERANPEFGSGEQTRRRIADRAGLSHQLVLPLFEQFFAARGSSGR
jgi:signal recognition particle subunit SRP54